MSLKIERINTNLKREISMILANEVDDKSIKFVTVTDVDTTNDLSLSKVYVTVLNNEKKDDIMKSLLNAKGFVRSQLFDRVDLRKIPDIRFIYDESIEYGNKIEKIIEDINN